MRLQSGALIASNSGITVSFTNACGALTRIDVKRC